MILSTKSIRTGTNDLPACPQITLTLTEEEGGVHLLSDFTAYLPEVPMICSDTLGLAFEPEQRFETPEGEDILFDTDFHGRKRETVVPGPFCR